MSKQSRPAYSFQHLGEGRSIRLPDWEHVEYAVKEVFPTVTPWFGSNGHYRWCLPSGTVCAEAVRALEGTDWFLRLRRSK